MFQILALIINTNIFRYSPVRGMVIIMERKKFTALDIVAIICAGITVIINLVAYFNLPDTMVTQISFSGTGNYNSTLLYLLLLTVLILFCAGMTVFTKNKTRWAILTPVLTLINIVCITLNLINL